jgi:methylenetetrahydrofolate dehydrogenase (NADP+) / methenyltetrahydrofolate cyclohydrolase
MMIKLDGHVLSKQIRQQLKSQVDQWKAQTGLSPCLSVVLVGEDPASQVYVRNKIKACAQVGILSREHYLPEKVSQEELIQCVRQLNQDPEVNGILVQLPLPKGLNADLVLKEISPLKDADGLDPENLGLLLCGQKRVAPCTPSGVIELLKAHNIALEGVHAVVVGRSQIVGKPMALLLLEENATVTICHSRTPNLSEWTQQGDIVVVAAGRPEFLSQKDFKPGAVVVDVGIHRKSDGTLCGDVQSHGLDQRLYALSPVPGGVGPMTITMLLANTLKLAQLQTLKESRQ